MSFVVESDEAVLGGITAQVFAVLDTEPELILGDEVYSTVDAQEVTLDVSPGVYYLSAFYKSQLGDISYGFKLEVVE